MLLLTFLAFSFAPSLFALSLPGSVSDDPKLVSSSSLPDAPDADRIAQASASKSVRSSLVRSLRLGTTPFSRVAVSVTGGLGGLGVDVATPLATKINLRASTSFLNYNPSITAESIPVNAAIKLRTLGAGVEVFPYHNTFHVTPGFTFYNGNHVNATAYIAGGSTFTANDVDYVSVASDPVRGNFDVSFGRKIAPSLTVGFGNMLRRDSHWSVPVDFGFEYIGQPKLTLHMTGSVCDPDGDCGPIANDPETLANLSAEQDKVNREIAPLRFYPILKIGLSYRFGHNVKREYWY